MAVFSGGENDRDAVDVAKTVHERAPGGTCRIVGADRNAGEKQAEEALRRYELLAQHGRDIILFVRRDDGRIIEANTAAVAAYGYGEAELLTMTILDLRLPGTEELAAAQLTEADEKGILFETVHRRRDGSTFPVEVSSQGATIGGTRTLISVIRDITERKRSFTWYW